MFSYFQPLIEQEEREMQEKAAAEIRKDEKAAKVRKLVSVSHVVMPEDIPIFATCDDVRRKPRG